MDSRFKHTVDVIRFPKGFEEEDRGFIDCCCESLILASIGDADPAINDISGVYVKKSELSDIITFKIEKCGTVGVLPNLGVSITFPNEVLGVGFVYDWRQYLAAYGVGKYKISVDYTISGIVGSVLWGFYTVKNYSIYNAHGTVRIRSKFDSYFMPEELDFTGSNYEDSVRFNGFFGNREPKMEINQLIDKGRKSVKTTRENLNLYTLRTDPVKECITRRLLDFHLLNEDECYITDHNASNHSYQYFDRAVVPDDSPDVEYIERSRLAKITATFGDKKKQDKSYYNG